MAAVTETVQIAARVPAEMAQALAELAKANERTPSQEIRLAIRTHLAAESERSAA